MTTAVAATLLVRVRSLLARHQHLLALAIATVVVGGAVLTPVAWDSIRSKHTEGQWKLADADSGQPGLRITIEGDRIHGDGPCNHFGATWSQTYGATDLGSTLIGCAPDVLLVEDRYFRLLESSTSVAVEDDRMTLTGPDGTLTYIRTD